MAFRQIFERWRRRKADTESPPAQNEQAVALGSKDSKSMPIGATFCHLTGTRLLVSSITGDGRVWAWNQSHPDKRIQQGDCITEVDGIRGNSKKMVQRMKRNRCNAVKLLPCRLASVDAEWREAIQAMMQERELSFEDLEMLALICGTPKDSSFQAPDNVSVVGSLPRVRADECDADECAVCLVEYGPSAFVCRLPCGHYYCPQCIAAWLTRYHCHCPICLVPVANACEHRQDPAGDLLCNSTSEHAWLQDFETEPDITDCDECVSLAPLLAKLDVVCLHVTKGVVFTQQHVLTVRL